MININIICIGKLKEKYLKDAVSEYSKRLSKYCKINIIELSDEKIPSKVNDSIINSVKIEEGTKIINSLKNDSYVFSLDLKGKQYSSEEFSHKIQELSVNMDMSKIS